MIELIDIIFPFSSNWHWMTFTLYVIVGVVVSNLCAKGAKLRANNESVQNNSNYYNLYYFGAFIILLLLATLRTEFVGSDTQIYVNYFEEAAYYKELYSDFRIMEQGFLLYNLIVRTFTDSYTIYFVITYSFVAWSYVSYIKNNFDENSNYIFLQLFIFFYTSNMSGIRSAIGISFLMFAFTKLNKGKTFQSIILTFAGSMFHYTMVVNLFVILVVWLYQNTLWIRQKWVWVVSIIISILISSLGVKFIKSFFEGTKYEYYASVNISDLSIFGSIFFIIFSILCIVYYNRLEKETETKEQLLVPFATSLSIILLYPLLYITGAYRVPNYYALPRLAIWSNININLSKDLCNYEKQRKLLKFLMQVVVILYLLFRFTRAAQDGNFAYDCILW